MPLWLLVTTQEPTPMRCLNSKHEDKYMVSSRKPTRREFCTNFPLIIFAALTATKDNKTKFQLPNPKFRIGDRVTSSRLCDDDRSPNFGGIDWEKSYVIGYCWNYDEWRSTELRSGWTYFIRFVETNNSDCFTDPWIDFEHEINLELVRSKNKNLIQNFG